MTTRTILIGLAVIAVPALGAAEEQQWGHLRGRLVFDGEPPDAPKITITKAELAFTKPIFDESLVVKKKDRGLANVLIFLFTQPGEIVPVHPSYAANAKKRVTIKMQNGRFEPHVTLLRTNQPLLRVNNDVAHNTHLHFFQNSAP